MTRKVLTYQAPAQLFRSDSLFKQHYSESLHIVATNSLKTGLGESLRDARWLKAPIITFSELYTELAGKKWSSSKAQLKQFLTLSDILSTLWEQNPGDELLAVQSIERNQLQVLKTLRMLTELEMHPNDLYEIRSKLNSSENTFLSIWKKMQAMLEDNSKQLSLFLQGRKNVKNALTIALNRWSEELFPEEKKASRVINLVQKRRNSNLLPENWRQSIEDSMKKKQLILHGFYFITPIQEKVFKRLEDEFDLIFLNSYDDRFPHTFETVKTFLEIDKNETRNVVQDDVPIHPLAARLVESFEGGSKIDVQQKVEVYNDLAHFVESEKDRFYSTEKDSGDMFGAYHLLTPRAADVEKHLIANEFVPPTKKKLTDYPIGRFLYGLHQMKTRENNFETNTVTFREHVTAEALLDSFSSGCLIVDGEDMRAYVKPLEKVIPYCKKATTFEQWIEQLKTLSDEKQSWETKTLASNKHALSNRAHKFHSLPMKQLSYFSVEDSDLEKIILGIQLLQKMNNKLFAEWDTKKVNISSHLKTLEEMVLKRVEEFFEDDEKEIVKTLIEEISELKDEEIEFSLKDISQGLLFYLDGTLTEANELETVSDKVFAFDQADGAPFRTNRKFHLAFADHKALPISQGYTLWPIATETMKHMEEDFPELELLEERKKQSNSITRYLLYVLFHSADDIRFSYAKNVGNESRLELALYLKLLDCQTIPVGRVTKEISTVKKEIPQDVNLKEVGWTVSMEREAKVCGKRAAFSFILNEHTSFQSDFHHGFLYQNYIGVLTKLVDKDTIQANDLRSVVDSWFPQWNNMKRSFLYESAYKNRPATPQKVPLDGNEYSQAISYLNLLPNSYASKKSDKVNEEKIVLHEANPGSHCKYCPYLTLCNDGIYSIDHNEEKETSRLKSTLGTESNEKTPTKKHAKSTQKMMTRQRRAKGDTMFSLEEYLKSKKLPVIDKREKKGALWIIGGKELQPIIDELKTKNIHFNYSKNGSRSTKNKEAWFYKGK